MDAAFQEWILMQISQKRGRFVSVGGGSINEAFRIECAAEKFFCKINSVEEFPGMFEKEKNGLAFLRTTSTVRVPEVICCDEYESKQILILEWIEQGLKTSRFWKTFGEQLAALHLSSDADPQATTDGISSSDVNEHHGFGFHEDNYMGALPQLNTFHNDWIKFFIECRLQPQLEVAEKNALLSKREIDAFHKLYERFGLIFPKERACSLHGDLWSGN
jgi:protein-ribulosamine 3-kinase